jgi:hypothetical protein
MDGQPFRILAADHHQQHRTKASSPSDCRTGQKIQKLIGGASRGYWRKVKLEPNLGAGQDQEVPDTRRVDHRGNEIDNSIQPQYDIIAGDPRVDGEAGCVNAISWGESVFEASAEGQARKTGESTKTRPVYSNPP